MFESLTFLLQVLRVLTLVLVPLTILCAYLVPQYVHFGTLPPGPPRSLLGFKKSTPALPPYKLFTALHKRYGPIVSLYIGKTPVVVLGTIKAATDLLEKRGNIYSSRPRNIMAGEILSGGMRGLGMPYGSRWRNWRALMHAGMGIEASQNYKVLQSLESRILLRELLTETDHSQYASHLRRFAISVVTCVGYGRRVKSLDDPVVLANQRTDEYYISLNVPGRYIVESWPSLLYLPKSLQWFRHEPEKQRKHDTELYLSLMNEVRQKFEAGVAQPSTAKRALEKQAELGLDDVETAFALSAPFAAGVGTTLATIDVFILAMLRYPDVMKKAQAELDIIVGQDRLPGFEDWDSLPYIQATIKETMRWRPIAPTGVPHSLIAEDTYEGMRIPKGSTVFANIYAMSQDEASFPSANEFKPERYLEAEPNSLSSKTAVNSTFVFGFGRRICPGMHVAQNSLFITISRILWAFNVLPESSAGFPPTDDFIGGLIIRPRPFAYRLALRDDGGRTRQIIEKEHRWAEGEIGAWA